MKVPKGVIGTNGEQAKGEAVLYANENDLIEYGTTVNGNHSSCYILTSPGDIITTAFAINSGVNDDFADLVVDGILRNSWSNYKGAKVFRHMFDRACHKGILLDNNRKGTRNARMKVISRNTQNDHLVKGVQGASAVSSISIQIFRKGEAGSTTSGGSSTTTDTPTVPAAKDGTEVVVSGDGGAEPDTVPAPPRSLAKRAPNFIEHSAWYNLNRHISSDGPRPPFEIGFFDGTIRITLPKTRVTKERAEDYKIWASFTFKLRSTADLRILGFDVPIYYPSAAPEPEISTVSQELSGLTILNPSSSRTHTQANNSTESLFIDEQGDLPNDNTKAANLKAKDQASNLPLTEQRRSFSSILAGFANNKRHMLDEYPEPAAPQPRVSSEPAVKAESTESENYTQFKARETIRVLPGMKCAPAHQTFLERSPTVEPELADTATIPSPPKTSRARVINRIRKSHSGNPLREDQDVMVNMLGDLQSPQTNEMIGLLKPPIPTQINQPTSVKAVSWVPLPLPLSYPKSRLNQAESEPQTTNFNATSAEKVLNEEQIIKSINPEISKPSRASSPALSETPTEVASPEEMKTTLICSFGAHVGFQSQNPDPTHPSCSTNHLTQSLPHPSERVFNYTKESPNLGSDEILMRIRAVSPSNPTPPDMAAVRAQVHWQNRLPMNQSSPKTPQIQSFSKTPLIDSQTAATSEAMVPAQKSTDIPALVGEKRKADSISGNEVNTYGQPRNTPVVPTLMISDEIERLRTTTEARIATAERQRVELQRRYEAALELQKGRQKIHKLKQEAEIIERENAEMESKIAAIYNGIDEI